MCLSVFLLSPAEPSELNYFLPCPNWKSWCGLVARALSGEKSGPYFDMPQEETPEMSSLSNVCVVLSRDLEILAWHNL